MPRKALTIETVKEKNDEDEAIAKADKDKERRISMIAKRTRAMQCRKCGETGHMRPQCPRRRDEAGKPETGGGSEREEKNEEERRGAEEERKGRSSKSSQERRNQEKQICTQCGERGHLFLDGHCPLLCDPEWEGHVQEQRAIERDLQNRKSSNERAKDAQQGRKKRKEDDRKGHSLADDKCQLLEANGLEMAMLTTKIDSAASRSAELKAEVKALQEELGTLASEQADIDSMENDQRNNRGGNALPEFELAIDMRKAIMQHGEEMCERKRPHFATVSGGERN